MLARTLDILFFTMLRMPPDFETLAQSHHQAWRESHRARLHRLRERKLKRKAMRKG